MFVVGYSLVHLGAALVFGACWFDRDDGFEAYSTLLGSLSVLGRVDGRLVLRSPLAGLAAVRPAPGLVAVVVVLVGSTAYDGLARTQWWKLVLPPDVVTGTAALLSVVMALSLVLLAGTWATLAASGGGVPAGPEAFAHSIVPIAAGYAVAHYFSLLLLDGQRTVVLASDPFGGGLDLLGTAAWPIDYTLVGPTTIALVQVGAIVAGHVVATMAAHDRALRLFPVQLAIRTQYPLLISMVGLTVGAVGLVFAA